MMNFNDLLRALGPGQLSMFPNPSAGQSGAAGRGSANGDSLLFSCESAAEHLSPCWSGKLGFPGTLDASPGLRALLPKAKPFPST